jgi:hypothetical protein
MQTNHAQLGIKVVRMGNQLKKSEIRSGAITGFWSGLLFSLCCVGPLAIVFFWFRKRVIRFEFEPI